jgi:hypothetical protein
MNKQKDYNYFESNNMIDLFGIIQTDPDEMSNNLHSKHINKTITSTDINKLNIDWPKYLNTFYNNHIILNDHYKNKISENIFSILTKCENTDDKKDIISNQLRRFININSFIETINELNMSYNQIIDYKDYTQKTCQDYYLNIITRENDHSFIISHWFSGIYRIDLNLYDGKHKVPYHHGIEIFKKYLEHQTDKYDNNEIRNELINKFINIYSDLTVTYLIEKFNQNKISLVEIFNKLDHINLKNELFIELSDCRKYLNNTIIGLVNCWEKYLETILETDKIIDEKVIETYNSVKLSNSNFHNITLKFCEKWQNKIKLLINPSNYGNSQLLKTLERISPLFSIFRYGYNKSDIIIKYFTNIYTFDSNLIGYIMIGFTSLINKIYEAFYKTLLIESKIIYPHINFSSEIINILILISIYEDKKIMWSLYFKNMTNRIRNQHHYNRLNINMINIEMEFYNILVKFSNSSCDKNKTFIINVKNSIEHKNMICKCKIKYINTNGESKTNDKLWSEPDLSKVDYIVIDKNLSDLEENNYQLIQLIDLDKYPTDIKTYIAVGNTYYNTVSETRKITWDIENSIINYNIFDTNIISTIVQYTLVSNIAYKQMTKNDLIEYVYNTQLDENNKKSAKKYLDSIIDFMCSHKAKVFDISHDKILCLSDKLITKDNKYPKKIINLTKYNPSLINDNNINSKIDTNSVNIINKTSTDTNDTNNSSLVMTDECINYLRLLILIKMFKSNSTKIYTIETINKSLEIYINKYISINKFNNSLTSVIKSLSNISQEKLINVLKNLEKRDIIEKITANSLNGYIYVL